MYPPCVWFCCENEFSSKCSIATKARMKVIPKNMIVVHNNVMKMLTRNWVVNKIILNTYLQTSLEIYHQSLCLLT